MHDQRFSKVHEILLFRTMLGSYGASLLLLLISAILVATGKRKLRTEVDAGVIVGIIASLFFNMVAIGAVLRRQEKLSWLHRSLVTIAFVAICIFNGMLLVVVAAAV